VPQPGQEGKKIFQREVRGNGPFKGPSVSDEWVTTCKGDVVRGDREGNTRGEI
jgi:hypothetical protein